MQPSPPFFLIVVVTVAWLASNGSAQVWPHMDALVDNYAMPGLFQAQNRTNPVWGGEVNGFQLGIETSKDTYGTNEAIHALVSLANLSALRGWAPYEYERGGMTSLELVLLHGRELVKSRYLCNRAAVVLGRSSGSVRSIMPGAAAHDGVRLDVQFMLEPNKRYELYAFRKASVGNTEIMVTSGNVSFIITNGLFVGGGLPPPTDSELTSVASQSTPPRSRASDSKQNRASPFAASGSATSGTSAAASTDLPNGGGLQDTRSAPGASATSVGFGGWLLIGFPLALILWILSRASTRAQRAAK